MTKIADLVPNRQFYEPARPDNVRLMHPGFVVQLGCAMKHHFSAANKILQLGFIRQAGLEYPDIGQLAPAARKDSYQIALVRQSSCDARTDHSCRSRYTDNPLRLLEMLLAIGHGELRVTFAKVALEQALVGRQYLRVKESGAYVPLYRCTFFHSSFEAQA